MWRALFPLLLCQCMGWREAGLGSSSPSYRSSNSANPGFGSSAGEPNLTATESVFAGAAAAGMTAHELATGPLPTTVLGWHLEVAGGRARFYACDDETTCGMRAIDLPASELTAMSVVGRARPRRADQSPDDEEKDVLRLTLRHPIARTSRAGEAYDENHGYVFGGKGQ